VRAGHVELEAIGDRRKRARRGQETLDVAAEDGHQQELVFGNLDADEFGQELLRARIGQAHGVDVTAGGIAGVDGFAISRARLVADALGGDDAHLRNLAETFPDGRRMGAADAGRDHEAAANRLRSEHAGAVGHGEKQIIAGIRGGT